MPNPFERGAIREAVYMIVDSERTYQDRMTESAERPDMVPQLSLGDHILAMEKCIEEARRHWYGGSSPHLPTLDFIRKVTGLGVRCMETFGARDREGNILETER